MEIPHLHKKIYLGSDLAILAVILEELTENQVECNIISDSFMLKKRNEARFHHIEAYEMHHRICINLIQDKFYAMNEGNKWLYNGGLKGYLREHCTPSQLLQWCKREKIIGLTPKTQES